jgi:hypothetical protein
MDTQRQGVRWSRRRWIATLAGAGCGVVLLGIVLVLQFSGSDPVVAPGVAARDAAPDGEPSVTAREVHTAPSPPSLKLPDGSTVDPGTARKVAIEYEKSKLNAFFDGKVFLANAMASGKLSVKALTDQLLSTQELQTLPPDGHVLTDRPAVVLDRMAMIDALEGMAEVDHAALDGLVEVGSAPIDKELAVHVKRAIAAERYDVFTALARTNWDATRSAFLGLQNQALMALVRPALIAGLVDSGRPRAEAVSTVEAL